MAYPISTVSQQLTQEVEAFKATDFYHDLRSCLSTYANAPVDDKLVYRVATSQKQAFSFYPVIIQSDPSNASAKIAAYAIESAVFFHNQVTVYRDLVTETEWNEIEPDVKSHITAMIRRNKAT